MARSAASIAAALFCLYRAGPALDPLDRAGLAAGIVAGGALIIGLSLMAYGVLDWHYRYRKDQMLEVQEAEAKGRRQA